MQVTSNHIQSFPFVVMLNLATAIVSGIAAYLMSIYPELQQGRGSQKKVKDAILYLAYPRAESGTNLPVASGTSQSPPSQLPQTATSSTSQPPLPNVVWNGADFRMCDVESPPAEPNSAMVRRQAQPLACPAKKTGCTNNFVVSLLLAHEIDVPVAPFCASYLQVPTLTSIYAAAVTSDITNVVQR